MVTPMYVRTILIITVSFLLWCLFKKNLFYSPLIVSPVSLSLLQLFPKKITTNRSHILLSQSTSPDYSYDAYPASNGNPRFSFDDDEDEHAGREKTTPQPMTGHINITNFPIDRQAVKAVPAKVVLHYKFMPLELNNGMLKIAVNSLNNVTLFDDLRIFLGYEIIPFLAREDDIVSAINQYYGIGAETIERIIENVFDEHTVSETHDTYSLTESSSREEQDASICRFVNKIFFDAYKSRATDIHIEPYEEQVRIRYRIDGELVKLNVPTELVHLKAAIISRIKVMSQLDIAERRLSQDGRIKVRINDRNLDLRISIIPTSFGESINIRLLTGRVGLDLEKLGFESDYVRVMNESLAKPNGIILVTGPTGSGKTSTLYTCLDKLNTENRKIITIEDPVEYNLEGITQTQTKPKIGLTFAAGLRSILRHDPDIMMVGEIRDYETAEIAFRSAMTGHLVFSTLHTNSASKAVTRLLDIGMEPYLIADSLECIVAQRLVRVLCDDCKVHVTLSAEEIAQYQERIHPHPVPEKVYTKAGCYHCSNTGFLGRTVVHELLVVDQDIKELIHKKAAAEELARKAREKGMKTLFQSGLEKVRAGITTFEEVFKVTSG